MKMMPMIAGRSRFSIRNWGDMPSGMSPGVWYASIMICSTPVKSHVGVGTTDDSVEDITAV